MVLGACLMLAVVMAGGKGTRLRPLTCDKPKPMVPVANRPLLEHVLRLLVGSGWKSVALTLCYRPEKIEAYFGNGHELGADLHYYVEDKPLGTAGSVKMAADLFDGTLLVASGDALCDFDLGPALAFHRERGALATIILTKVESPLEYGVVMTDADGRVVRFLEKPGWGEVFSDTVNSGFYLIEPEAFSLVPSGEMFDFSRDLFPEVLRRGGKLFGYIADGYWSDIGTLEQYRRTHHDILNGRVKMDLSGQIRTPGVYVGAGSEIDPEAVLEGPALIGEYCRIERGAKVGAFSVIGDYSLLGGGVSVKHSVIWRHVYLGEGTEVRGAVVGDHCLLRNNVSVYEGAVVGDGCQVGSFGMIRPGVKLWPGKEVESGGTVSESLVWNQRAMRGLFGTAGVSGVANVEMTPEFAVKLGAAFAAAVGRGRQIAVASDGFSVTKLLERAATAGILGVGLGVRDLGSTTVPVARYAVGALGLAGGMYIGLSSANPSQAVVQFMDARGLPVERQMERAIEQAFFTGDFPRAGAVQVGELSPVIDIAESYLDGIRDTVDHGTVRAARYTVVLGPCGGPAARLLQGLLARLGCLYIEAELLPETSVPFAREAFAKAQGEMEARLAAVHGTLAVAVDGAGEDLFVLDTRGRAVGPAQMSALISLAELRRDAGKRLPIRMMDTDAIADLAKAYRGQVVRTKGQRRALLQELAADMPAVRGLILPAYDAFSTLALLLELLARDGRDLAALIDALPAYQRVEKAVACTWEAKGWLMRRLAEEERSLPVDLTDGLRVQDERGWALVLPDGEEPFIRVFSEAKTAEEAAALNKSFVDKIAVLQRSAGNTN